MPVIGFMTNTGEPMKAAFDETFRRGLA